MDMPHHIQFVPDYLHLMNTGERQDLLIIFNNALARERIRIELEGIEGTLKRQGFEEVERRCEYQIDAPCVQLSIHAHGPGYPRLVVTSLDQLFAPIIIEATTELLFVLNENDHAEIEEAPLPPEDASFEIMGHLPPPPTKVPVEWVENPPIPKPGSIWGRHPIVSFFLFTGCILAGAATGGFFAGHQGMKANAEIAPLIPQKPPIPAASLTLPEAAQKQPPSSPTPTHPSTTVKPCTKFKLLHGDAGGPEVDGCFIVGCQEGYAAAMAWEQGGWNRCSDYAIKMDKAGTCVRVTDKNQRSHTAAFIEGAWTQTDCPLND